MSKPKEESLELGVVIDLEVECTVNRTTFARFVSTGSGNTSSTTFVRRALGAFDFDKPSNIQRTEREED